MAGPGMESTPRKTESGTDLAAIRGHPQRKYSDGLCMIRNWSSFVIIAYTSLDEISISIDITLTLLTCIMNHV